VQTRWDTRPPHYPASAVHHTLAADEASRQAGYRALFRHPLDAEAIGAIRLALSQSQPLGNARFLDTIERVIGHRREAKPRGRPRVERTKGEGPNGQVQIEIELK
jgi:putative transposase